MVIDIHNHIWTRDYMPDKWWSIYSTFFSTYISDSPFSGTPDVIQAGLFAKSFDPTGEDCLREMEEAVRIQRSRALVCGEPHGHELSDAHGVPPRFGPHDAVVQLVGRLDRGHLADVGRRARAETAGGLHRSRLRRPA